MRSIYLVMSQTGTLLSRAIKVFTGDKYNHISLSFDDDLSQMYSFGRKYPRNPFIGVFVVEGINKGTFKRFKNTKCKVIKIDVSEEQYECISSNVEYMLKDINKYKYNLIGLFMAIFNIHINRKNRFYCSEFVKHILSISNVDVSMIPEIPHPVHFLNMEHDDLYEGFLREYSVN